MDRDFLIDFAFSTLITLLRGLASKGRKAAYEKVFLKLFKLIWGSFGDSPKFRAVVGLPEGEP